MIEAGREVNTGNERSHLWSFGLIALVYALAGSLILSLKTRDPLKAMEMSGSATAPSDMERIVAWSELVNSPSAPTGVITGKPEVNCREQAISRFERQSGF